MRILLTGATGQLGRAFVEVAGDKHEVVPLDRQAADLEDADAARRALLAAAPDAVVHAGAMTNVDQCEREPERALAVNALATGVLAMAAREVGAHFEYVSTDYVFDGARGNYREDDATAPLSAYGRTKLEGERLAVVAHPLACVARTAVVFGPHKRNFVTWVADELRAGRKVTLAEDQRVSPTLAHDLAETLLVLTEARQRGVWHCAGASQLSRMECGRAIAEAFGLDPALLAPVKMADLQWVAPRPRDSTLDVSKVARLKRPLSFPEALARLKGAMPA